MDGGSKMDAKEVCGVVQNKLEDYEKRLDEIINAKEQDLNLAEKYRNYITCLSELNQQLFRLIGFKDHVIFETLQLNYGKHDTKFIFLDDSSYTVKQDDVCTFKDNYVLIVNKDKYIRDKCLVTEKAINLDNVKLVETLS